MFFLDLVNLWVILVGAVRKWLLSGASDYLFFSVHGLVVFLYWKMWRQKIIRASIPKWFYLFGGAIFAWAIMGAMLSGVSNIYVTLLGLMNYFLFMPLAMIIPCCFKNSAALLQFLKKNLFWAVPVLILGFAQYFSPQDSFINKYIVEDTFVAMVSDRPRITGTFSYISGFSTYIRYIFGIFLGLIFFKKSSIAWFFKLIFAVGILAGALMTGSRGVVGILLVSAIIFLGVMFFSQTQNILKIFFQTALVVLICLAAVSFHPKVKEAYSNFMERVEQNPDVGNRLVDNFTPFKFLDQAGLFGYGIGTTYAPAERFVGSWGNMPRNFEEEPERVVLEVGLIGYFLVYGWRLMIFLYSIGVWRKLKNHHFKLIVLSMLVFQAPFLQLQIMIFSITTSFYYWLCVGIIFAVHYFEKKERGLQKKIESIA